MNNTRKFNLISTLTACVILASCSSLFGGSGSGSDGYTDGYATNGAEGSISDSDLALGGNAQDYSDGNIPLATEGGLFQDIFFDYDSSRIRPDQVESIRRNAEILSGDPSLNILVEGHCDSRGTSEYNLALGEERAKTVASMLVNFGANPNKVSTVSYGEEIPLSDGISEQDFAQNRRVHFALSR